MKMTKKEMAKKKAELCELQQEAIKQFKDFFKGKKEELKQKNKKIFRLEGPEAQGT